MQKGFIKLHRSILEWEWYDDQNTMRLFLHLLLNVNHKEKQWRGITVKKGQKLTSQIKLAEETGLTRQQIRTSLKKLIVTNEITIVTNAQHTVVTVNNWDSYQDQPENQPTSNQPVTNEQPTSNQRVTTNKNVKNVKNVKKKDLVVVSELDFSPLKMNEFETQEFIRIQKKNNDKKNKLTQRIIKGLAKQFEMARTDHGYTSDEILTEWEGRGWKSFKSEWVQSSFTNQQMKPKQEKQSDDWALKAINGKNGVMF